MLIVTRGDAVPVLGVGELDEICGALRALADC